MSPALIRIDGCGTAAARVVEAAQVFAQQAPDAGITVNIRRVESGEFFSDMYLSWDFAQHYWFTRNFLTQAGSGSLPDAPYNETHWNQKEFNDLVYQARATTDPARRNGTRRARQADRVGERRLHHPGFPEPAGRAQRSSSGWRRTRAGFR
ncbi:peptide ABC transporter substrate-binding protein [Saccharopolyspora spinosa]|uniref:peptide ABC transporter substrate-binding protein n=1 Tax=Saccharopolyspora spinosa TaxID=60894 RepID=UPI00023797E3|nr:peptide ABC transporter substrate-binding protein [Saccharopolyspora spinosa]